MLARSVRMLSRTLLISFASLLALSASAIAATLPSGFTETRIAFGITNPTAMDIAPDGRIFVAEQAGRLRVIRDGVLLTQPFLQLNPNALGERGLLGVALDPQYEKNNWIYLYYSQFSEKPVNILTRYELKGDSLIEASKKIVLEVDVQREQCCHTGGSIAFDGNGNLFLSTGDNTSPRSTRSRS